MLTLAGCILLTLPIFHDVLVVSTTPGPDVDFDSISAAISAASEGDLILVRSGQYGPIQINGKGLTVAADTGAEVILSGPTHGIFVSGLAADQSVVIQGLKLKATQATWSSVYDSVIVSGNSGSVWLESLQASNWVCKLRVLDSDSVILSGCKFRGENGPWISGYWSTSSDGGTAMWVQRSCVHLFGTSAMGGEGGLAPDNPQCGGADGDGGHGIRSYASELRMEASTAVGGDALDGWGVTAGSGVLLATGSKFVGRQSTIMGGKSSTGVLCAPSYSGVRFLNDGSSSVESIPGPAALFDGPGVVRPGESLAFNFQAGPGSWAYLLVSESTADLPLGDAGILHLLSPQILDLGPVGANGKLTWPTTLGLPPAPVTLLGLQAVAADPSIGAVIGQVRSLAWLAQ